MHAVGIRAASLGPRVKRWLVAGINQSKFAEFDRLVSSVAVERITLTHADFEFLISEAPLLGLSLINVLVAGSDVATTDELQRLLDEGAFSEVHAFLRARKLSLGGAEFYTRARESLYLYASGLAYAEGDPVNDVGWNQIIANIVMSLVGSKR